MKSKFVLRDENDTENPFMARLYGKGITQGRTVFYQTGVDYGNRTAMLVLLCQGARERNDLGCSKILKVLYAGFEIPEFDVYGGRNWKFHPGTITTAPVYQAIDSINSTDNTFHTNLAHGLITGDYVAMHRRGTDVENPTTVQYPIGYHDRWFVWKVDNNNFKILFQAAGTPNEAMAFDLTNTGTNIDRLFFYKANSAYRFDPVQGKPDFFWGVDFNATFAGIAYLEIKLPENLSNSEDEPTNLKVILEGKLMYGIEADGDHIAFDTNVITPAPNPALVSADTLYHDQKVPLARLHNSFVTWRDRCDETIEWSGGNDSPSASPTFTVLTGITFDAVLSKLTKTGGSNEWNSSFAVTNQFVDKDFASAEFIYRGGDIAMHFNTSNLGNGSPYTRQGLTVQSNLLLYNEVVGTPIVNVQIGDRIKMAYEQGLFVAYLNGIPLPQVTTNEYQKYTTFYIEFLIWTAYGVIDEIMVAPSGLPATPREIKRFQGGFVSTQPAAASDIFEIEIGLTPGCSYADVDGQIRICTEPNRTPCFTFIHDPSDPEVKSNVAKVMVKRRNAKTTPNFWRYIYRNDDDPYLKKAYTYTDRKERREANGGRQIDFGQVLQYGVMTQSQMDRIGEANARLNADLDIGFEVEAFLDSLAVCKGSFVNLVDPLAGYTQANPALCMVVDERQSFTDIETRIYELQVITPNFYSDTDHGQVNPPANSSALSMYYAPPAASALTLSETTEAMADNSFVSTLSGAVDFTSPITGQRGSTYRARVFKKVLTGLRGYVAYNHTTELFTIKHFLPPAGDLPLQLVVVSGDTLIDGASFDVPYYAVEPSGLNFKLSLTEGGPAVAFGSSDTGLRLYDFVQWADTGIDVFPDAVNHGAFEIIPIAKGFVLIRVQTFSRGSTSLAFEAHITKHIEIVGDITPPLPPTNLQVTYDGVNITFTWQPSPTPGVVGYIIKDEFDRFVRELGSNQLSYVQTAQGENVTRRIYAVSSTGVLSATYAEVTFIVPLKIPLTIWTHEYGVTSAADFSLTKTAASGYTSGVAVLNHSVITDSLSVSLSGAPDKVTNCGFGFSFIPNPTGIQDIAFGIQYMGDGTMKTLAGNAGGGGETIEMIGAAHIELEPDPDFAGNAKFSLYDENNNLVWDFSTENVTPFLYPMAFVYTQNETVNFNLVLKGDLMPTDGTKPATAQNLVNANYVAATGVLTSTGGSGWGSAGASFPNLLIANHDGGWLIDITQGDFAIGLATSDPDQTADSINFNVRRTNAGVCSIRLGATEVATGTVTNGQKLFIGRENGIAVIRGGAPGDLNVLYAYEDAGFKAQDVILDAAFRHDQSPTTLAVQSFLTYKNFVKQNGDHAIVVMSLAHNAYTGLNVITEIPEFNITDPAEGDALVFDTDLRVINSDAIGGEATLANTYGNDLAAAITAIGSTPTRLVIDAPTDSINTLTVPDNIALDFRFNGQLTIASNQIVTIENGLGLTAPSDRRIFAGAGNVSWTVSAPETLYPEWYGAVGDGTTDDLWAFNKICDSNPTHTQSPVVVQSLHIFLACGKDYKMSDTWHINTPVFVESLAADNWQDPAKMTFAANKSGIVIHHTSTQTGTDEHKWALFSRLANFSVIGAVGSNTHTVTVNGLAVTKTAGFDFSEAAGTGRAYTITINGFTYVINTIDSTSQVTLYKPRITVYAYYGSTEVTCGDYNAWPTTGEWNGQNIKLDGVNYQISSVSYAGGQYHITLATPYLGQANGVGGLNTTFSAFDAGADSVTTLTTNPFQTGQRVTIYSGGTLPTPLANNGIYYIIVVDSTHVKFASTRADALANTPIDLSGSISGTHTIIGKYYTGAGEIQSLANTSGLGALPNIYNGINLKASADITHVRVWTFAGNGIALDSATGLTAIPGTAPNSNNSHLDRNNIYFNRGHGIYTKGINSNQCKIENNDSTDNYGAGIFEGSFLGNNYIGNHTSFNYFGATYADGPVNVSLFLGEYAEGGQPSIKLDGAFMLWIGGNPGCGFDAASIGGYMSHNNWVEFSTGLRTSNPLFPTNQSTAATRLVAFMAAGKANQPNTIFAFGAAEETYNLTSGGSIDSVMGFVYQLGYDQLATGWYNLYYGGNYASHQSNGVIAMSGSQASVGGGKLAFPNGFRTGITDPTIARMLKGTVTINPTTVNANSVSTQTFTLSGAASGDSLQLNLPAAGLTTGLLVIQAWVSATNQISITFQNTTGSNIDEASADWTYLLIR